MFVNVKPNCWNTRESGWSASPIIAAATMVGYWDADEDEFDAKVLDILDEDEFEDGNTFLSNIGWFE